MLLLKFDLVQTIAFACFLSVSGLYIYNYFRMESSANVPPVIVGGIIFVIARFLLKGKVDFEFDFTFFEPSSTLFFTIIGFGITAEFFKHTQKEVFYLLISATGLLILQNLLAHFLGKALGLHPLVAFMTGSVALTGGSGTASAVAATIESLTKMDGLLETGITISSLGILFASLLGTPFCTRIIEKKKLISTKNPIEPDKKISTKLFFKENSSKITLESILMTIFQLCIVAGIAVTLSKKLMIPSILIAILLAVCLRGFFDTIFKTQVSSQLLHFFADFNLMILLALSMMKIDLHNFHTLSIPLLLMFTTQIVLAFFWCYFVTYKLFGGKYKAVLAMAGHLGFGIGTTENALVNLENLSIVYEPDSKITFATVVVGAFLIDIVNVNVLYLYFNLIY